MSCSGTTTMAHTIVEAAKREVKGQICAEYAMSNDEY